MYKIIKKIVYAMFFVLGLSGLTACGQKTEGVSGFADNKKVRYSQNFQNVALSEAGIIKENLSDGLIHLFTIDEGKNMILCYDPNCRHIRATEENPDSECMGAVFAEYTRVSYYEGCVYFFVQDSIFSSKIYKMKTDGAGRILVAELPFTFDIANCCIFNEDKLYYMAKIGKIDELTNDISVMTRMVEVNILDGSYRFLTEETADRLLEASMSENTLYLRRALRKDGLQYGVRVNLETLETGIFIDPEKWHTEYACMGAYDNDSFFYIDWETNSIGIRNVDGTIEKVLLEGAEGEKFGWPIVSCDGLFYERTIEYGDESIGYYFLDFITREVTNITDEQAAYGLVGYDGYYDAFIGYDEDNNVTMWSKEKVLGEAKK